MNKLWRSYLAGFVDADGTFTMGLTIKNNSILMTPAIRIALKQNDSKLLISFRDEVDIGKIYYSNKDKPHGVCAWQTTNTLDSILLCKVLLPYLRLKKERAERFLKGCQMWQDTMIIGGKRKGSKVRTKEQISKIINISLGLNPDRQTIRYREKKGWDYWEKKIDELYVENNSRTCSICESETTYVDPNGHERWYKDSDGFLCQTCWNTNIR